MLRASGQPLAVPVKEEMEARFSADFSRVRVHTDGAARASAAALGARAYTLGDHVVIGEGGANKHVLAHELTHVIQQRQGPVAGTDLGAGLKVSDPLDVYEKAAEANAVRVMRTQPTVAQAKHQAATIFPLIQRMTIDGQDINQLANDQLIAKLEEKRRENDAYIANLKQQDFEELADRLTTTQTMDAELAPILGEIKDEVRKLGHFDNFNSVMSDEFLQNHISKPIPILAGAVAQQRLQDQHFIMKSTVLMMDLPMRLALFDEVRYRNISGFYDRGGEFTSLIPYPYVEVSRNAPLTLGEKKFRYNVIANGPVKIISHFSEMV